MVTSLENLLMMVGIYLLYFTKIKMKRVGCVKVRLSIGRTPSEDQRRRPPLFQPPSVLFPSRAAHVSHLDEC